MRTVGGNPPGPQPKPSPTGVICYAFIYLAIGLWCTSVTGDLTLENSPTCIEDVGSLSGDPVYAVLQASIAADWRYACDMGHKLAYTYLASAAAGLALGGLLVTGQAFDDEGNPTCSYREAQLTGLVANVSWLVFLIQFLLGYDDLSDECDGTPDFEALASVHTVIVATIVINTVVICGPVCCVVAARVAMATAEEDSQLPDDYGSGGFGAPPRHTSNPVRQLTANDDAARDHALDLLRAGQNRRLQGTTPEQAAQHRQETQQLDDVFVKAIALGMVDENSVAMMRSNIQSGQCTTQYYLQMFSTRIEAAESRPPLRPPVAPRQPPDQPPPKDDPRWRWKEQQWWRETGGPPPPWATGTALVHAAPRPAEARGGYLSALGGKQPDTALGWFVLADKDESSTISKDEAIDMIQSGMGLEVSPEYIHGVWSVYDVDGNGTLDLQEFEVFLSVVQKRAKDSKNGKLVRGLSKPQASILSPPHRGDSDRGPPGGRGQSPGRGPPGGRPPGGPPPRQSPRRGEINPTSKWIKLKHGGRVVYFDGSGTAGGDRAGSDVLSLKPPVDGVKGEDTVPNRQQFDMMFAMAKKQDAGYRSVTNPASDWMKLNCGDRAVYRRNADGRLSLIAPAEGVSADVEVPGSNPNDPEFNEQFVAAEQMDAMAAALADME